jgi:hypothetical protein
MIGAYPIVARFFDPKNPSVPAVTDYVSVRGDLWGSGQTIVLNAYDLDGKRIESATVVDDGQSTMTIAASGIHTVEFLGNTGRWRCRFGQLYVQPRSSYPALRKSGVAYAS